MDNLVWCPHSLLRSNCCVGKKEGFEDRRKEQLLQEKKLVRNEDMVFAWFKTNKTYKKPRSSLASSLIISRFHGGSKVSITFTSVTPSIARILVSTSTIISPATGQPGAVRV